ncbi:Uncharacterized protein Adt_20745 [Abeliophyllum distichum]|uniref:Transposase (putative) gypsy type domain-containing protein n=1 Tax=Abeliophyllum distichum TaxID=126358 RepID=A0ABD1SXH2_9LAMI
MSELSGGHEDPKAELEDWACSEYPLEINISNFTKLRNQYRILECVRLIHLNKTDRPWSPGEGYVAIMSDARACRMRLHLHPFFRAILRSYNLCQYQLSPNFWTQIVETWILSQSTLCPWKVPAFLLTEKDLAVIDRLYSYKRYFTELLAQIIIL